MIGTIDRYDHAKRFGFVRPDGATASGDVFFHVSQFKKDGVEGKPAKGDRILFLVESSDRGPRAVNIARIV